MRIYTAVLKAVALKRIVRVIVVQYLEKDRVKATKIYFSTKTNQEAMEILEIYQARFQIEFLPRCETVYFAEPFSGKAQGKVGFSFQYIAYGGQCDKGDTLVVYTKRRKGSLFLCRIL